MDVCCIGEERLRREGNREAASNNRVIILYINEDKIGL